MWHKSANPLKKTGPFSSLSHVSLLPKYVTLIHFYFGYKMNGVHSQLFLAIIPVSLLSFRGRKPTQRTHAV